MDENAIRGIVADEFAKQQNKEDFRSGNPRVAPHSHNGRDNLEVTPPFFTFIGFVPYANDPTLQSIMPGGWSVEYTSTGVYRIFHYLSSTFNVNLYSITASAQQSTNKVVVPVIEQFDDSAYISWFDSSSQAATATSFSFILSTGTNALIVKSQYVSRNV